MKQKATTTRKLSVLECARGVLITESDAIRELVDRVDERFQRAVGLLYKCRGRVVVTGMGKPGIIGQKISATLSSTGTPSLWLHPAEAVHGDLGRVTREDIVIALSNSGETEEITRLLPMLKKIGTRLIALTGNIDSTLARYSDEVIDVSVRKEACPMGIAPTASTAAMLAMGDALAVALLERRGFSRDEYSFYHPAGVIGKKLLLKVEDVMRRGEDNPVVSCNKTLAETLLAITGARAGCASIVDDNGILVGIFTDGDLRRQIEKGAHVLKEKIRGSMVKDPVTVTKDKLAAEAVGLFTDNAKGRKVGQILVVDKEFRPVGHVEIKDLVRAGIA
jgi:arabinose-5-phosphate isomerase